jgi:antitoxin MazE
MKSTVQKWGNSLAVRIPKSFANEIGLSENSAVELTMEGNALQLQLLKQAPVTFESLVSKITPENLHGEFFSGPAAGKEIW